MDFTKANWKDNDHGIYDGNQYYIARAFPKTGAGIPARFMVGKTLEAPIR